MISTTFEMFYIYPHIYTLAKIYPLDVLRIAEIWKINNYCSIIKLEQVIKDMISRNKQ